MITYRFIAYSRNGKGQDEIATMTTKVDLSRGDLERIATVLLVNDELQRLSMSVHSETPDGLKYMDAFMVWALAYSEPT